MPQRAPLRGLVLNRPLPGLGYPGNQQCPSKPLPKPLSLSPYKLQEKLPIGGLSEVQLPPQTVRDQPITLIPVAWNRRGILYLLVSTLTLDPAQPPTPPAYSFEQTTHLPSYVI